jgi:predicted RecA/RadA family phage recombinase
MKNYHSKGDTLTLTPDADGKSGDVVIIGEMAGVALSDHTAGTPTPIRLEGVVEVTKAAGAIAEGVKLYVTPAGEATATAGSNTPLGHAASAALGADATVLCKLGR